MKSKTKVIAYIFREKNNQQEILVFDHRDFPSAGVQVVGGTVEPKEHFEYALKREILEESGLVFEIDQMEKIGETTYHRLDFPEENLRHYYRIKTTDLPDSWTHIVVSDGADNDLVFLFYWLPIHEARNILTGNFAELL